MKAPKKRTILNIVMVIAIVAILVAGVLMVGTIQGWFDGQRYGNDRAGRTVRLRLLRWLCRTK